MLNSNFQSLVIMSNRLVKDHYHTLQNALTAKKTFFSKFGGCFFLPHLAAKFWGKKNHPPLPVVAVFIMPNVIVNKTSVNTLLHNLKLNLNFAAVLKISKTLETC